MTIGTSLFLIAAGAILRYAVTTSVSWVDIQTVGLILLVIGIIGFVVSTAWTFMSLRSRRPAAAAPADPHTARTEVVRERSYRA
jgi:hypothetical protein